ncbi:MAG: hypothetical protein GY928_14825 [Colwellia sp.]|nr:hypothetical protein [Colwellia sp.]
MRLICKKEALDENGEKVMAFTKGVIYDSVYDPVEGDYIITDDDGGYEIFFNYSIMFDKVN